MAGYKNSSGDLEKSKAEETVLRRGTVIGCTSPGIGKMLAYRGEDRLLRVGGNC